ncbi:hypothetical protein GCM10017778_70190 [Streptomyces vinaceus]|nr:hypothetical protein GCM10017778_70190 [Streptomyces vinaceus]
MGSAAADGLPVTKETLAPKASSTADISDTSLFFPVRRSASSAVPTTAPRVGRADVCVAKGFGRTRSAREAVRTTP